MSRVIANQNAVMSWPGIPWPICRKIWFPTCANPWRIIAPGAGLGNSAGHKREEIQKRPDRAGLFCISSRLEIEHWDLGDGPAIVGAGDLELNHRDSIRGT